LAECFIQRIYEGGEKRGKYVLLLCFSIIFIAILNKKCTDKNRISETLLACFYNKREMENYTKQSANTATEGEYINQFQRKKRQGWLEMVLGWEILLKEGICLKA
jgi:hypothetical protein